MSLVWTYSNAQRVGTWGDGGVDRGTNVEKRVVVDDGRTCPVSIPEPGHHGVTGADPPDSGGLPGKEWTWVDP